MTSHYFPAYLLWDKAKSDNIIALSSPGSLGSTPHAPRAKKTPALLASYVPKAGPQESALSKRSAKGQFFQKVQPFRRCRSKAPPQCVPLLDLSSINQPDDWMDPVEVKTVTPLSAQLSQISLNKRKQDESPEKPVHSASRSAKRRSENWPPDADQRARLDLVEKEILSHERNKQVVEPPAQDLIKGQDNMLSLGLGVPEASLAKRLRFEARILTYHGRDVHRQLCGFFFLADGSISIYEFRQFGKKSTALPLIHRDVYSHCEGRNKGTPYKINYIKKGATLLFKSRNHPGLSTSLASKQYVFVRVIQVDEQIKQQLLCDGLNPIQCRQVELYLSAQLSPISLKDHNILKTLQGMVCSRLSGRASRTLVGLGRHLATVATTDNVVSFHQLQIALRKFHISLTVEDMQQLKEHLSRSNVWSVEHEGIWLDFCLQSLTGGLYEDRASLIRQVFMRLDSRKSGYLNVNQMKRFFIHGSSSDGSLESDMFDILQLRDSSSISYPDFETFHLGLSIEVSSDSKFTSIMRHFWGI